MYRNMNIKLLTLTVSALALSTSVDAAIVTASQDGSVYSRNPTNAAYAAGYAGLSTGGQGISRFYQQFILPAFTPGTEISSATLQIYHGYDPYRSDDRYFSIWNANSDGWSEYTLTWNSQPGPMSAISTSLLMSDATLGEYVSFDITSYVNQQYLGDGLLTTILRADDEALINNNQSLEYFNTIENGTFIPQLIFTVTTVPVPTAIWLFGSGLIGLVGVARRQKL